jgi:hypothetical protein
VDWSEVDQRIESERAVLAVGIAKEDFVATVLDGTQEALFVDWLRDHFRSAPRRC